MSGLSSSGFTVKTLAELISDMKAQYQADLGIAINLGPRTPQGQVIANVSAELADLWELGELVYNSFFPDTASGVSLDNVASITGIVRIAKAKSLVVVTVTGTPGTVFPVLKAHVLGDATKSFTAQAGGTIGGGGTVDVTFESDDYGPVIALATTLTEIDTPFPGVDSINNADDATLGRLVETDAELRIRRAQELQRSGTATVEGIRNALMTQVADVTNALVIENTGDTVDLDGRPPHCFEAVVIGGLDQDVANEIFASKPAGIATYGTTLMAVVDSMGFAHQIYFSRPTPVPIYITAVLVKNVDPTEPPLYPAGGDAAVQQAIIDFIATLTIGQDVVRSRIYTPINTVEGILGITLTLGLAPGPVGVVNIPIAADALATADATTVVVS